MDKIIVATGVIRWILQFRVHYATDRFSVVKLSEENYTS